MIHFKQCDSPIERISLSQREGILMENPNPQHRPQKKVNHLRCQVQESYLHQVGKVVKMLPLTSAKPTSKFPEIARPVRRSTTLALFRILVFAGFIIGSFVSTTSLSTCNMMKRVPKEALFVSEPNPAWFGNGPNEPNSSWNNGNWLKSRFHFSFAEYESRKNTNFGVLRVMNDDLVQPQRGFGAHPHRDMEILTFVVKGGLTHQDSMGNKQVVHRGGIQYMSAGTGVRHSEFNHEDTPLRFIQCWVVPDRRGYTPRYGQFDGELEPRTNAVAHLVSSLDNQAIETPVKVHQDVNVFASELEQDISVNLTLKPDRMMYLLCMEGEVSVSNDSEKQLLSAHDALELFGDGATSIELTITATATDQTETGERASVLIFEMANDGQGGRKDL